MKKVVSVIIPVYNVEEFIFRTVESVMNQDYKNIEIILVDDGSLDNSAKIINELAKKDDRITCVHKENGGVLSARNAGLRIASGEYVTFTGNMSAMLIGEYILSQKSANGTLPENPAFVESIVSTDMGKAIAAAYGVKHIEVLTGFKYIGEQMLKFEKTGCNNYVFGMEESYGCLPGTYARDKDAPAAVCMLCEVAAFYKSQGKTLWDGMIDMYEKYGYYREGISTLTLKGIDGAAQINEIMTKARAAEPKQFGDYQVLAIRDYKNDTRKDMTTGKVEPTGLPSSNVLYYELNDNAWCCVRPSGTEPKIKFYFGVKGVSLEDSQAKLDALSAEVLGQFE